MPKTVITGSFSRITEHLVGLVDLFEPFHRIPAPIVVRMILEGELPESLFNLRICGAPGYAQNLIIISLHSHSSTNSI
jgi:hypothetical protein